MRPSFMSMIVRSTSAGSGRYGTTAMRPRSAALKRERSTGRTASTSACASLVPVPTAASIASVPRFEVITMTVFLKSTTRPSPSASTPLSKT